MRCIILWQNNKEIHEFLNVEKTYIVYESIFILKTRTLTF